MLKATKNLVFSLVFIAAGIVLLVLGVKTKEKLNDPGNLKLTAKITDIRVEPGDTSDDGPNHTVYVEYELNGEMRTAVLNAYASKMRIGDELAVVVDPGDPSTAMHDSKASLWIMFGMGILGIVCGGFMIVSGKARG